eukprot:2321101-Rhodomonas_salina.5
MPQTSNAEPRNRIPQPSGVFNSVAYGRGAMRGGPAVPPTRLPVRSRQHWQQHMPCYRGKSHGTRRGTERNLPGTARSINEIPAGISISCRNTLSYLASKKGVKWKRISLKSNRRIRVYHDGNRPCAKSRLFTLSTFHPPNRDTTPDGLQEGWDRRRSAAW